MLVPVTQIQQQYQAKEVSTGVYLTSSRYPMLDTGSFIRWFPIENKVNYGLCASFNQVLKYYPSVLTLPSNMVLMLYRFDTAFTIFNKKTNWGEYVGGHKYSFHFFGIKQ
jgi:hypothetical protein